MIKKLLSLLLLSFFLPLEGYLLPESGSIGFEAEFLFFKANIENNDFSFSQVQDGENHFTASVHKNEPQYKPAYRLGALFESYVTPSFLEARFTYFNGGFHKKVFFDGGMAFGNFDVASDFAEVGVEDSIRFYGADLTYNYLFFSNFPLDIELLSGLNFAWLKFNKSVFGTGGVLGEVEVRRRSWFWGVGPELGLDLTYLFWNQISLISCFRGSVLLSRLAHTASFNSSLMTSYVNLYDPEWKVIPGIDWRMGLFFRWPWECFRGGIELGYEFIWYYHCLSSAVITNSPPARVLTRDLTMHGPYASLKFLF